MFVNAGRIALRTLGERRARMAKHCAATGWTTRLNVAAECSSLEKFQSSHNSRRDARAARPTMICLSGILALLGFEKPKKDDPITDAIKRGLLALQRKEFNKAEQFLHIALKLSQDGLDEAAITYCYDVMANIAYERGDYVKAEKLFVETMKRMIANGTPRDDNAIVEMSLKIATMNGREEQYEKAELGYRFCIDTQRRKLSSAHVQGSTTAAPAESARDGSGGGGEENDHLLLGLSLDHYGDYLLSRKMYSEAQQAWSEALTISRRFLGPEHEQSLVISCNLALALERLGKVDEAVAILESIVSLEGIESSEDLPIFLCNLGMNYITQRRFSKAEEALSKAQKLAKKYKDQAVLREVGEYLDILRDKRGQQAN